MLLALLSSAVRQSHAAGRQSGAGQGQVLVHKTLTSQDPDHTTTRAISKHLDQEMPVSMHLRSAYSQAAHSEPRIFLQCHYLCYLTATEQTVLSDQL